MSQRKDQNNKDEKINRSDLRVRELWVGNLPENITEKKLYSNFFIYGEIDRIEIVPHKNQSQ